MRFSSFLAAVSALSVGAVAEQFSIPEVDAAVAKALAKNPNHDAYTGPVNKAPKASPAANSVHTDIAENSGYWYENIAHQGISAFGPSGYSVCE